MGHSAGEREAAILPCLGPNISRPRLNLPDKVRESGAQECWTGLLARDFMGLCSLSISALQMIPKFSDSKQ